jgi:hypothetical protein
MHLLAHCQMVRQPQPTIGLICQSYLESCPRTAPFGNAALWTLM